MKNLKDLPLGDEFPEIVNAIIEIPKGERTKYEYDPELGVFKLDRVLHGAVHYPAAYGFIPSTLWDDGDPLDILVVLSEPLFPGCLVRVRPIAVLKMRDDKGLDDKLLGVAVDDPINKDVRSLKDLPAHIPYEIENFFTTYKILEKKHVDSFGWGSADAAVRAIKRGAKMLKEQSD